MNRLIDDVVETLRKAKDRDQKCTLLIGAGCSVKAGIPTAAGFVEIIRDEFPNAYNRAKKKTYPSCMSELAVGERRELIARYVDAAKLNWAHIAIAQLMKCGYIDRVLTTNFDLLVVRACALLGEFPAIYDFAASQLFQAADIPDQAVFYLHGQRTGFVLMNTEEESARHSKLLKPVFDDAGRGRVWLVVGYSGDNDPVFDHLVNVPRFDWNLYWVGYKDTPPPAHVRDKLLIVGKYAFYVQGFDADDFFVTVAQRLKIFPPGLFATPFTHLKAILETVTPYTLPGESSTIDVTDDARKLIQVAIEQHEAPGEIASITAQTKKLLLEGKYDEAIAIQRPGIAKSPELKNTIAWAYVAQGNALIKEATTKTGEEADKLYTLAGDKYAAAVAIKPDRHEALYNWGIVLDDHASTKTGREADKLYTLAGEKYAAALAIKPDSQDALNNWALILGRQARTKTGEEADKLYTLAGEKYAAALAIKPDYETLFNWGRALEDQARTKTGEEADKLYTLAGEKYAAVLAIKPDYHQALNNWGIALAAQAMTKAGEEADKLYTLAGENYAAALAIKPDKHEALYNWGIALTAQAKTKTGESALKLQKLAEQKMAEASKLRNEM